MVPTSVMAEIYKFGLFRLDPDAGILFLGAEPKMIGQRAVALLRVLLAKPGMPVSKDVLIDAAWSGLAVEESNLTVQMAALRRALAAQAGGENWIETLSRRGYRYVGPVVAVGDLNAEATAQQSPELILPDTPSIAVLPFLNLGGDCAQEYFADGIVDDIITGLSRIKWLFVIARNSSFAFRGRSVDLKHVGRELGVRYILEGSVRKADDRVRVNGQLVDAATGLHVWAERYDRKFDDIFALQDEIAISVVGAIEPSLRQAEVARVERKRPDSLDAYDLVLQAQADIYSGMPERSAKALVLLERALALDPDYALGHGLAAMGYHNRFLRAGLHEADRTAAIRHARAALANGQDDALALTFAGFSIGMDAHDRTAAFTAFQTALAVSSSTALAYILGSVVYSWAGQAERAIEWGEQGMRLSPFDPWAFAAFGSLALGHFLRGRYDEAVHASYQAVQSNPGHSINYVLLAATLAKVGRLEEARAAASRVLELQPAFRYGRQFSGVDCAPELAVALGAMLDASGLPK